MRESGSVLQKKFRDHILMTRTQYGLYKNYNPSPKNLLSYIFIVIYFGLKLFIVKRDVKLLSRKLAAFAIIGRFFFFYESRKILRKCIFEDQIIFRQYSL